MSDTVTEEECTSRQGLLHARINDRPTLKIVLIAFAVLASLIGYVYSGQDKIVDRQWAFTEKMVTKDDFTELKQDIKGDLEEIQRSIENIGR